MRSHILDFKNAGVRAEIRAVAKIRNQTFFGKLAVLTCQLAVSNALILFNVE